MSPTVRVWWNRSPASSAHLITACRHAAGEPGAPLGVISVASHPEPDIPVLAVADEVVDEPDPDDYLAQALELCERHRIDLVLPRVRGAELVEAADRFAELGTTVVASPAASIRLADDKLAAYRAAAELGLATPPVELAADAATLFEVAATLAGEGHRLCVRPRTAEGSDGFRLIGEPDANGHLTGRLSGNRGLRVTLDEVAAALDAGEVDEVLVAGLLTGTEWSADCLAHRGRAELVLPRRRDRFGTYLIEACPPAEAMARALIEAWDLHGVVNVQCFVEAGRAQLVEVNPRPAGGLHHSHHTGRVLIYESLDAAMSGEPRPRPAPRLPVRVLLGGVPVG